MKSNLPFLFSLLFVGFSLSLQAQVKPNPKVEVLIEMDKDTVSTVDSLVVRITLVNRVSQPQQVLFDKPGPASRGPWGTTAIIMNGEGGRLELTNKANLSSKVYFEDELRGYYYTLEQGQKVSAKYYLKDILLIEDDILAPDQYTLQVVYMDNWSNKVNFGLR